MFIALPLELASLSVFSMALYLEVHLVRGDYEHHLHLTTSHIYTTYYILLGLPTRHIELLDLLSYQIDC